MIDPDDVEVLRAVDAFMKRKSKGEAGFHEVAARARLCETMVRRERIVEAFIAETGLSPSECELVEQPTPSGGVRFWVQRRGEPLVPDCIELGED